MTHLKVGVATDTGRARQINQDMSLVAGDQELWAVADGMGGHRGGEVASELAVSTLRARYGDAGDRSLAGLLEAAGAANTVVFEAGNDDPDLAGMGTTLVAIAHTDDDELAYINVGDSRIYLFRSGELSRLTADHSLVEELVREGSITPEEARTHPKRNIVTRVIGPYQRVEIDGTTIIPYQGDRFVLCSDGLFNEVDDDRIASVLRRLEDPSDAATELVRLANDGGGRDNITVLIVDVVDDDGRAEKASALVRSTASADDVAGFSVGADLDEAEPQRRGWRVRKAAGSKERGPRRVTWRVVLFLLMILAVLGAGVAAIGYYARGTYYVGFDGDVVTVFQGKPGGVLWFQPTVVERTEFTRADVRPELVDELTDGIEIGDRTRALGFPITVVTTTTTTTTTSTTTTSTTVPPSVPPPAPPP